MSSKKKTLKSIQTETENIVDNINVLIEELGIVDQDLSFYLNELQKLFDQIRNIPSEQKIKYIEQKKICVSWKQHVEKIEKKHNEINAKNAGAGAAGASAGVAVAAMGPTAAMGVATTFGVASTGTAISSLSGAAATNAALAWLGGGALAANGGGMAAGGAFLAMFGPLGWSIAGLAALVSGITMIKGITDQHKVQDIFIHIASRDKNRYKKALAELKERIKKIRTEIIILKNAVNTVVTFGTDYDEMTEEQQYKLGAYFNAMNSSIQQLVSPIMGLQPLYSEKDFSKYMMWRGRKATTDLCHQNKNFIIAFANLLYQIPLDKDEKKLLWKTFKSNKKLIESFNMKKKDLPYSVMEAVYEAIYRADSTKEYI